MLLPPVGLEGGAARRCGRSLAEELEESPRCRLTGSEVDDAFLGSAIAERDVTIASFPDLRFDPHSRRKTVPTFGYVVCK